MIRLENVSKSYDGGKTYAIQNFNLTINQGDFVALLGPSGCGKSTTLMLLCGLYRPTEGNIYFGDRLVNNVEPKNRNIGMVFQSYALYPHLSVYENIAFPIRQQKGVTKRELDRRVREVADMVKITNLLERMPGQLSGGQQQRVAMCRALVKNPNILLLDEPMSNLDARLKLEIRDEIKKLQADLGLTSIIVTHDQDEAMAISNKIAVIDDGIVQQYADPNNLYDMPKNLFVASFIGSPPMNFIEGEIQVSGDTLTFKNAQDDIRLPLRMVDMDRLTSNKVTLGARPHHFIFHDEQEAVGNAIGVHVEYVEPLGKELLLKCHSGATPVRILSPLTEREFEGKDILVGLQRSLINIFDSETGENITLR
ncbi:MAG TPA: ABC transporter ATP-binding protein [Clostridiaceae bacterium]|nr:ABC transporter ATP-binding protein [Clostridiaceae bacterium]